MRGRLSSTVRLDLEGPDRKRHAMMIKNMVMRATETQTATINEQTLHVSLHVRTTPDGREAVGRLMQIEAERLGYEFKDNPEELPTQH